MPSRRPLKVHKSLTTSFIGNRLNVEQLIRRCDRLGPLALGPGDNVYHYADGVWNLDGERQVRKRVRRLLQDRRMESHTSNVLAGLKSEEQFLGTENDPEVLNVTNGLLDWRTGELTEHTPTVPSTYQLTQAWNPEATCPKVDEWLTFIACGDADLVSVLWEIIAVSVMSSAPVHRAALFTGSGRNGKSTALRLIEAVVGKKHCSSVTLQELANNRFAAADLFGAVANIGGDLDSSHLNRYVAVQAGDRRGHDEGRIQIWSAVYVRQPSSDVVQCERTADSARFVPRFLGTLAHRPIQRLVHRQRRHQR